MEPNQAKTIAHFLATRQRMPENMVFVGRSDGQFSGNAKYVFLHFVEHVPQCKSVFVTVNPAVHRDLRDRGLPTARFPAQDALEALARASVVVVDDFQFRENSISMFAIGAKIVQLWHGVGFKKIGFVEAETSLDLPPERRAYLREMYSGYDAVVSTSPFYTEHLFKTSFGAREIWETGYPRNDALFRKCTKNDLVGCDVQTYSRLSTLRKKFRTCLYAPTFRDDGGDPFQHGALRWDELSLFLQREGIVFFLKLHTFSKKYDIENLKNVVVVPGDSDIYPMLPLFDCMITDYSSIYMDYLLLQRPVVFFPYDRKDYETRLRQFQFDYDDMTPGPKCLNQDELLRALRAALDDPAPFREQRTSIRDMAFSHHDGRACWRVAEHILRLAATV